MNKKNRRTPGRTLSGIMAPIVRHWREYTLWDHLFFLSTGAFLLFWVMVHGLADRAGTFAVFSEFLLKLLIAVGIGGLLYGTVVLLPRRGRMGKILANAALILAFSITVLIPLGLSTETVSFIAEPSPYFSTEYADEVLVNQMIAGTRFLGHGGPISDEVTVLRTEASFDRDIWADHLLISAAYTYGSWMVLVLSVIVAVWCVSSVRIYLKIYSRWFEWVFVICFIAVAYQMIPPVLFATGLLHEKSYAYDAFYRYDAYGTYFGSYAADNMAFLLTIPVAAMLAVIKRNNDAI